MWLLKPLSELGTTFNLLSNAVYIVGRKDCEILLPSDQAVSRKHAQIKVSHLENNITKPDRTPVAVLTDLSKFGTWLNNVKLNNGEEKLLSDGDQIMFGSPKSSFMVVYEPLIISTSCLDNPSKKLVRTLVTSLGGHMVNEWRSDCHLLVMNSLSVTIKVISALVSQKHIVTPAYLENVVKKLKEGVAIPDPDLFLPNISETQINPDQVSFKPDVKRATVFQGMKFIFLSAKQFKKMSLTVEMGGGLPILMDDPSSGDLEMLVEPGSVVMQSDPSDASQGFSQQNVDWITQVIKYLKKHKKHLIQDAELGFAVLHCSTEQHCNPDVPFMSQIPQPQIPSQSLTQADILAHNTEPGARSPVIESRNDPSKIDETTIEPRNDMTRTRSSKNQSKRSNSTALRQLSENETMKESNEQETLEPSASRNTALSDTVDGQCLGRQVKKEKITPNKQVPVRQSPRRSPSPVSMRVSPKRPTETNRDSKSPGPSNSSRKSDSQKAPTSKVKVELQDDSDEFSAVYETEKEKKSVKTLENEEWSSKHKNTAKKESRLSLKKHSPDKPSPSKVSSSVKGREKRKIIVEDSDEEELPSSKRSRNQPQIQEDEEEDLIEVMPSQSRGSSSKTTNAETDLFDVEVSKQNKESKSRSSPRKKSRNLSEEAGSDEDLFNVGLPEDSPEKSTKKSTKKSCTSPEKSKSPEKTVSNRYRGTSNSENGHIIIKEEIQERYEAGENVPNLPVAPDSDGFLCARVQPGTGALKSEYVDEKDLPSGCILMKFVDLVTRPTRPAPTVSGEATSQGYIRWKGKLVKNFKKFKKNQNCGSNGLPHIIGGSDLQPHVPSQRKEVEDWFREALETESQQSEAERRAQELFDYEPNKTVNKRRGR